MDPTTWIGIALCLSQSAMFSGLNLAVFSVGRLRLEVDAAGGDKAAARLLALRRNPNFVLATILWGNVCMNVLLTLLADSVLTGVAAFLFSTVVITFLGEILPQAYFSRRAVRIGARFTPLLRAYGFLLYPVARPSSWMLDRLVGPESRAFFRERDFHELIRKHVEAGESDVSHVEGSGAINFLELDDVPLAEMGEPVDPRSVIALPMRGVRPELPPFERVASDPFLQRLQASGRKWVVITDLAGEPKLVMHAHRFLRHALFGGAATELDACLHRPIVVRERSTPLGDVIGRFRVSPRTPHNDLVDDDVILLWGERRRLISGSDILGRLLRGIARLDPPRPHAGSKQD